VEAGRKVYFGAGETGVTVSSSAAVGMTTLDRTRYDVVAGIVPGAMTVPRSASYRTWAAGTSTLDAG
jgi:hypothetical protein